MLRYNDENSLTCVILMASYTLQDRVKANKEAVNIKIQEGAYCRVWQGQLVSESKILRR